MDRCLHSRYILDYAYDTVYVDLDDTLIIHDKINLDLVRFLYQCVNKSIRLILISKNLEADKEAYLKNWRLSELFDEKIWLKEEEEKYPYMKGEKSIYIDDSFSQRARAAEQLKIPTFDASMVEALIDDRVE